MPFTETHTAASSSSEVDISKLHRPFVDHGARFSAIVSTGLCLLAGLPNTSVSCYKN